MSEEAPRFPDYGDDADIAGARRGRRAFRLCVAAVVLLTWSMWFSERFLKHDQAETLYLSGITLPRDSSRVLLEAAILDDAKSDEQPTPKYSQALAVRQEDDIALNAYLQAWNMDTNNSLFAIRYGSRLFLLGRPAQAVEKFRTARGLPPANALPRYLEAAAIARMGNNEEALREAMIVVSRTNNAGVNIIFPNPFWYSGYPETGLQYAELMRGIVDESCAPLYHLSQQVVRAVTAQLKSNQTQHTRTWIEQMQRMGARLVEDSEPHGTLQAIAGITIQQQMTQLLESLEAHEGREVEESLIESRVKLEKAMELLTEFENARQERLEGTRDEYMNPLRLASIATALLIGAYLLSLFAHKILRLRKSAWALRHSTLGKWVLGLGITALFLLLQLLTLLQQIPDSQEEYTGIMGSIWWAVVGLLMIFGLVYPGLTLSTPEEVSRKSGRLEEMPHTIRLARQAYRRVYAAMIVRYYGILGGVTLCTFCVWVLSYRIVHSLYPWQVNILSDGLLGMEFEIVEQVLALLR